jgi:hypothetical protein
LGSEAGGSMKKKKEKELGEEYFFLCPQFKVLVRKV